MKKYLILMLLLLSQCSGYSPIFSKNKINFYFDNININSNDLLSSSLKQQLNNYKYSKESEVQRQKLDIYIDSSFERVITSKDKKKNPDGFKMSLTLTSVVKKEDGSKLNFAYTESFNYSKSDRTEFEIKKYENVIKDNLVNSVINKLINDIIAQI